MRHHQVATPARRLLRATANDLKWLATGSEIRFCTALIGLVEIAWALIGLAPPPDRSLFAARLFEAGMGLPWFGVMGAVGIVTLAGAVLPWRRGRHIGQALSAILWLAMAGVFLDLVDQSPVAATMPLFAIFSLGMLYADAKRKPRAKPDP